MKHKGIMACSLLIAACALGVTSATSAQSKPLKVIRFAMPTKAISPIATNYLIPEHLGYYRQGGLTLKFMPLGSVTAAIAALSDGRAEFAALPASSVISLAAHGHAPDVKGFYEMTYPFKYGIAVNPKSPIHSISQLRGKTIGVANFGTSEYIAGQALLRRAGINPKTDVHWLAVGSGVTAGIALKQKRIAAFVYWDTGFGQIEAAGIPLRFLPIKNPPDVGGIFISSKSSYLKTHRSTAIAVGKAIAEASLFIRTNPRAAAYAFIKEFPSATPKLSSIKKQVDAVSVPIKWRMPLYRSKDPALTKWGQISGKEWTATEKFLNVKNVKNLNRFYTNSLIDPINKFDAAKIRKQAKNAPQ